MNKIYKDRRKVLILSISKSTSTAVKTLFRNTGATTYPIGDEGKCYYLCFHIIIIGGKVTSS